jgi:hypothetical protein
LKKNEGEMKKMEVIIKCKKCKGSGYYPFTESSGFKDDAPPLFEKREDIQKIPLKQGGLIYGI